jgi:oligopeptide transport system substrate-binding protein
MTKQPGRQSRWLIQAAAGLLAAAFAAACGTTQEPTPTPTDTPTTAPSSTPTSTTTPAPTPRPLTQAERSEGRYYSSVHGASIDVPTSWEITASSDSDFQLLELEAPDEEAYAALYWEYIDEGADLEQVAQLLNDELWEVFDFDEATTRTGSLSAPLSDGTPAIYQYVEATIPSGVGVLLEMLVAESNGKAFTLTMMSRTDAGARLGQDLNLLRESLHFEPAHPYGVDRENALFLPAGEPETLDPAKFRYSPDSVIGDLYSGLVRIGPDLQLIPDLVERWEVSTDGTTYTFYLRRNVRFHSGRQFTAQDVLFTIERALDPETESDTAITYLDDILGAKEFADGESDSIPGIRVLDDYTVELRLVGARAYFLHKLAYPVSWIVDRETVHEIEDNPVGTGPFAMMKHVEDEIIVLGRNPTYHLGFVPLEYVVYLLYPGYLQRLYESEEIDLVSIDEELVERARDQNDPLYGTVHETTELCTTYVLFDTSRPPFDDVLVRRAFAYAVDRQQLNEVVFEGRGVMAAGLYPPGLPGFNSELRPSQVNFELAQESLDASSYGGADGLPEIILTTGGAGSGISASTSQLIDDWERAFGIDIQLEQLDSENFYDEIYGGHHGHLIRLGWCADYPDPQNFADVLFHSETEQNHGKYSNPEVDALLEQGRGEPDFEKRVELYRSIEQQLIDDAAAIFLWHSRPYYIATKPYVNGYVASPIGVAQLMNLWIERGEQ